MTASDPPLVTVCVPTYNRAATVRRTVESVIAQTYRNLEILISDNASTDGTEEICRDLARSDARIRYVRQPQNIGMTDNFQWLLRNGRGPLTMWFSDDDWMAPEYVEQCLLLHQREPALAVAGGIATVYETQGHSFPSERLVLDQESGAARTASYYANVQSNFPLFGLMRRDLALQVGFPNRFSNDCLFMAGMAFLGKIVTTEHARAFKSPGGMSDSEARHASDLGISRLNAIFPGTSLALSAFLETGHRNRAFASLSAPRRWWLALQVFVIVLVRFGLVRRFKTWTVRILRALLGEQRYRNLREHLRGLAP